MFDGCLVEKTSVDIKTEFNEIQKQIKEINNFDIKIVQKSTQTKWVPVKGKNVIELQKLTVDKDFGEKFSKQTARSYKQTARSFFDDSKNPKIVEGRYKEFMDYMNRFVCQFDEPNSYGFRMYDNTKFKFRSLSTLRDRIGLNVINTWNMSDDLKVKKTVDIITNIKDRKWKTQLMKRLKIVFYLNIY